MADPKGKGDPAKRAVVTRRTAFSYARGAGGEKLSLSSPEKRENARANLTSNGRNLRLICIRGVWSIEADFGRENDPFPAVHHYRGALTESPYAPGGDPRLPAIFESPEFRIREISHSRDDASELAKVAFEYSPKDAKQSRIQGWLRLDITSGWVVRDFDLEERGFRPQGGAPFTLRTKGFMKYNRQNGRAIPAEVEVTKISENGWWMTDHFNIAKYEMTSLPPAEFTLAAFGLADFERTLEQAETRRTYRTAVLAGGAFLVASALFGMGWQIQKRRKRTRAMIPGS